MQKVEGSSPFSRFDESPAQVGLFVTRGSLHGAIFGWHYHAGAARSPFLRDPPHKAGAFAPAPISAGCAAPSSRWAPCHLGPGSADGHVHGLQRPFSRVRRTGRRSKLGRHFAETAPDAQHDLREGNRLPTEAAVRAINAGRIASHEPCDAGGVWNSHPWCVA
jgi:hypothetical protein